MMTLLVHALIMKFINNLLMTRIVCVGVCVFVRPFDKKINAIASPVYYVSVETGKARERIGISIYAKWSFSKWRKKQRNLLGWIIILQVIPTHFWNSSIVNIAK